MPINGWFASLRNDGIIASGDAGIWLTALDGTSKQVSPVGLRAVWCGQQLVYNRNDGTTQYAGTVVPVAYNAYVGCDDGQWAGVVQAGAGRVDRYIGVTGTKGPQTWIAQNIGAATAPQFLGRSFGWLTPYQAVAPLYLRTLVIDGVSAVIDKPILDWRADRAGGFYLYVTATGTYARRIFDNRGNDVTIRPQQDETPLVAFTAPDGYPWMVSQTTNAGTFVRMIYSAFGYQIPGELFYPDARVIGARLHVVGSLGNGAPRDVWIDFNQPMVDLRTV